MTPSDAEPSEPIRFRPSKKRKIYRQRATSEDSPSQPPEPRTNPRATAADFFDSETQKDGSEPTVVRAAARQARRGVGFGAAPKSLENDERSLVVHEAQKPVEDRFVKHTGTRTVVDDRHMNAFIESRLSTRSAASKPEPTSAAVDEQTQNETEKKPNTAHRDQIQEVDLPQHPIPEEGNRAERPKKVRLGPDGKPWRGGRRKRRGSDDVARDRLVEELLHENRLDVYDHPAKAADEDADGDADERIATQFKQQYLEDVARKQQRQKAAQQKLKEEGEILKGPKLGGSRNDRAAVREALLKTQREGQK